MTRCTLPSGTGTRSSSDSRIILKFDSSSSGPTARSSDSQMCTRDQSRPRSASSSWQRFGVEPPASARWKTPRASSASPARRATTSAARTAAASESATVVRRTGGPSEPRHQAGVVALGAERLLLGGELLVGPDDVHDRVDERQVREGLREVAEMAARPGVDLLGVQVQRRGVAQQLLAQVPRSLGLTDLAQRAHEPERADRERALFLAEPVVGLVDAVAQHEAVEREVLADRQHRRLDALVVGRQEAHERQQQARRIQRVGLVVLTEHAVVAHAMLEDVGLDLLGDLLPLLGDLL